jgi:hypothetical protein
MDRLDPASSQPWRELSRVAENGVVLWRMSNAGHQSLWCLVFDFPDGFHLVLDDDPAGDEPSVVVERHSDIVAVVDRADSWRTGFRKCGWSETDVE